jgi:hypothetical protein
VGSIRQNLVFGDRGLEFFVCGDQLLRGAVPKPYFLKPKPYFLKTNPCSCKEMEKERRKRMGGEQLLLFFCARERVRGRKGHRKGDDKNEGEGF